MSDPLLVEFIELQAKGVTDVDAEIKEVITSIKEGKKAQEEFLQKLNDPKFRSSVEKYQKLKQAQAESTRIMKQQAGALQQQQALEARLRDVQSGRYTAGLQQQKQLIQLQAQVDKAERSAQMRQKYGRFGGLAEGMGSLASSKAVGVASAAGTGLFGAALAGASGSAEMEKLTWNMTLLSRELAGALKPAIEFVTSGLQGMRHVLEKMGPAGQKALSALMLIGAAKFVGGKFGIGAGMLGGLASLGGSAASLGGQAAGGAVSGASSTASSTAAMAAANSGATGRYGAIGAMGGRAGLLMRGGLYAGVAAGVYNTFSSQKGREENYSSLGFGPSTSKHIGNVAGAINPGSFLYDLARGKNPVKGLSQSIQDGVVSLYRSNEGQKDRLSYGQVGFSEAGSSYERLADSFQSKESANLESGNTAEELKANTKALQEIREGLQDFGKAIGDVVGFGVMGKQRDRR